jgi:16S rRNA m(7)G-527 methyltransferase (EC 2.1.1.-)
VEIINRYFTDFTDTQTAQFNQLGELYTYWNERINVISRKDVDSLYEKHVLHSLSITTVFSFLPTHQVVDLGTGGGFPGIPLAIFFPDTQFTLIDSIGKKITVVKEVVQALRLKNVTAIHGRVEQVCKPNSADFVVSRAVAPLNTLWQWSKPILRNATIGEWKNGLICLKGGDLTEEIADSGCRPFVWSLRSIFAEPFFEEKSMLYIKR